MNDRAPTLPGAAPHRRARPPAPPLSVAIATCAVLAALAGASQGAPGRRAAATQVLYVESNDFRRGMNSVFAFRRDRSTGCLTPLAGSPFLTRGTGVDNPQDVVGPLDSDQDLIADPAGRRLFVTNGGSNTIAVFNINPNGSLSHVRGSPFPSGGIEPVSVGLAGDKLVVVNKSEDPAQSTTRLPNYTTFRVSPQGRLTRIPRSTIQVPEHSSPTQALISPNGRFVFGADIALALSPVTGPALGSPVLRAFRLQKNGRLTPSPNSPYALPATLPAALPPLPPLPPIPLGLAVHPRLPILYSGVVTSDRLAVYSYSRTTGELFFQGAPPISGRAICWVRVNKAGTRIYTVNTIDASVSVFDSTDPLRPTEIQHLVAKGPGDLFNVTLDPSGRFLYVVSQRSNGFPVPGALNQIHIFQIGTDGKLTEAECSPEALPAGATFRAQGVVAL